MKKPGLGLRISEIHEKIEKHAPASCAESWDNVGLLVGDSTWKTRGAVIATDLTPEVILKAEQLGYRLIVIHHPCIFPASVGLTRITDSHRSKMVLEALKKRIAVIASHTNFDRCAMEVVERVSQGLGVMPQGRLLGQSGRDKNGELLKLSVFVPGTHLEALREALCQAGAGVIGNYDSCSFSTAGVGTFRGREGTRPFLGKPGILEKADEYRLETILPRTLEKRVIHAMRAAHPYEEVAYDLVPLLQSPPSSGLVFGLGYGFYGEFKQPKKLKQLYQEVLKLFRLTQCAGICTPLITKKDFSRSIKRIAFVAGNGSSFVESAACLNCDLLITGETGYHKALDGMRRGMMVWELGHHESEGCFPVVMEKWLRELGLKTMISDHRVQSQFSIF